MALETDRPSFLNGKPVGDMTLVEISEQLDRVTAWMEAERVKEREARTVYQQVAQQVEGALSHIRSYAQQLVDTHSRRVSAFSGLLSQNGQNGQNGRHAARSESRRPAASAPAARGSRTNIADAILHIWTIDRYKEQLTTDEISEALADTGYKTKAAPTSLKSSINQSLAKLCRTGHITRFRSDGTRIDIGDTNSRARKYIASILVDDE